MKSILLFACSVMLMGSNLSAQTFPWVNTAGNGTFIDYGFGVTVDNNHDVLVTGMHFETAMFGSTSLPGAGYQDAFVAKYDSTGTLLWVNNIGGGEQDWGYAVATDASNNVYVTGTFAWYAVYFTPTDSLVPSAPGATNTFTAKYDAAGNFLWARGGGCSWGKSSAISIDPSGNVIVGGFYNGSINFSGTMLNGGGANLFFVKYSPTGNLIWAKSGSSTSMCATNALKCDAAGNIYATGKISQTVAFDGNNYMHHGGDDLYTLKLNSSGILQWISIEGKSQSASTTSNNFDCGNGLDIDASGNVYVTGSLLDTFVSGAAVQSMVLIKYNNAGVKQWTNSYGNNAFDVGNSLSLDADGNPFIIGSYKGALTIGPAILPTATDMDLVMAKFDPSGSPISVIALGTGNGDDNGNGIYTDKNGGSVYLTGSMRGTLNFGSIPVTADYASTIFVAKLIGVGGSTSTIAEADKNNFVVYPNPATALLNIQFEEQGEYTAELYSITGQLVLSKKMNEQFDQLDLNDLEAGIYTLSMIDQNGNRTTERIVKK